MPNAVASVVVRRMQAEEFAIIRTRATAEVGNVALLRHRPCGLLHRRTRGPAGLDRVVHCALQSDRRLIDRRIREVTSRIDARGTHVSIDS